MCHFHFDRHDRRLVLPDENRCHIVVLGLKFGTLSLRRNIVIIFDINQYDESIRLACFAEQISYKNNTNINISCIFN